MKQIRIILVQTEQNGIRMFRIAKLMGGVKVDDWTGIGKRSAEYHVGDVINEATARVLANKNVYDVTVTQQKP